MNNQYYVRSREVESGWDYVVVKITLRHIYRSYDCWEKTFRSPYYSKEEWNVISRCSKKGWINESEFSQLKELFHKEKGPLELKMTPYNHWGWRGRSA